MNLGLRSVTLCVHVCCELISCSEYGGPEFRVSHGSSKLTGAGQMITVTGRELLGKGEHGWLDEKLGPPFTIAEFFIERPQTETMGEGLRQIQHDRAWVFEFRWHYNVMRKPGVWSEGYDTAETRVTFDGRKNTVTIASQVYSLQQGRKFWVRPSLDEPIVVSHSEAWPPEAKELMLKKE